MTCVDGNGHIVPNEYCNPKEEPKRITECYTPGPCKPQWRITPWSQVRMFELIVVWDKKREPYLNLTSDDIITLVRFSLLKGPT